MNEISNLIKKIRKSIGLTQKQFAEKVGKTQGDIAKYETGRAIPPGNILLRIQKLESKSISKNG